MAEEDVIEMKHLKQKPVKRNLLTEFEQDSELVDNKKVLPQKEDPDWQILTLCHMFDRLRIATELESDDVGIGYLPSTIMETSSHNSQTTWSGSVMDKK